MEISNLTEYENDVVVIGLGFVGLTLSLKFSEKIHIFGIEKDIKKTIQLSQGNAHFFEEGIDEALKNALANKTFTVLNDLNSYERTKKNTTFIITIGTPVKNNSNKVSTIIENLLIELNKFVNDNDIIIFRSTVTVGTTKKVYNWFSKNNKIVHLSFCPERTIEGKALSELTHLPQIISGTSDLAISSAYRLFSLICSKILIASNTDTAELAKLSSNIERDVYFSFANELGFISRELNIDYSELKSLVTTDYPRSFLKHVGPVAGPCLEKDTYILKESLNPNFKLQLIETARSLNESWIYRVGDVILKIMNLNKLTAICLSGLAFKGSPPTDDLRGSLAIPLYKFLIENNFDVYLFDPYVNKKDLIMYFNIEDSHILNDWDEIKSKNLFLINQNGSQFISKNCTTKKISFLDITSFNNSEINRDSRLF